MVLLLNWLRKERKMNIKRELFISIIIFLFIDISTINAEEIDTLKSRLESVSKQDKIEAKK